MLFLKYKLLVSTRQQTCLVTLLCFVYVSVEWVVPCFSSVKIEIEKEKGQVQRMLCNVIFDLTSGVTHGRYTALILPLNNKNDLHPPIYLPQPILFPNQQVLGFTTDSKCFHSPFLKTVALCTLISFALLIRLVKQSYSRPQINV